MERPLWRRIEYHLTAIIGLLTTRKENSWWLGGGDAASERVVREGLSGTPREAPPDHHIWMDLNDLGEESSGSGNQREPKAGRGSVCVPSKRGGQCSGRGW